MLSLEEKIGQMLGVGFHGFEPPDHLLAWLRAGRMGALVLYARNVASPAQLAELIQTCQEAAPRPLLIAIDQEGGTVARLRQGFTESPGAMALGAAGSEVLAEQVSAVLATELRALGINWNLAPVVDITHDINNPSVGTRSLGTDPEHVSRLVRAEVRGFQQAGVAATAKHFPGIGKTPVDTHVALAVIDGPLDYLWTHDLVPFRAAVEAGVETVMVSHVKFPALDPEYPSTLSPRIVQGLLRQEIGFKGMVCTDCMEMRAVSDHYGPGESTVLAALAGNDLVFFSHTPAWQEAAYDTLLAAARSGRLPLERIDQAVGRITALKDRVARLGPPYLADIRRPDHLDIMRHAARRGMVAVRIEQGVLPLKPDDSRRAALVEFASHLESEVVEHGDLTGLVTALHHRLPKVTGVSLKSAEFTDEQVAQVRRLAADSDVLILATRNAHLIPAQRELAQDLIGRAKKTILLCLRNPYDVDVLSGADTILCTCGDSTPSLEAAVEALLGQFSPSARLPVPLETVV